MLLEFSHKIETGTYPSCNKHDVTPNTLSKNSHPCKHLSVYKCALKNVLLCIHAVLTFCTSSDRSLYQANVVMWGIGKIYFHFQGELEMDFQMSTCLHHVVENCDEFVFMTPLPQPLSSLWSQSSKRLLHSCH